MAQQRERGGFWLKTTVLVPSHLVPISRINHPTKSKKLTAVKIHAGSGTSLLFGEMWAPLTNARVRDVTFITGRCEIHLPRTDCIGVNRYLTDKCSTHKIVSRTVFFTRSSGLNAYNTKHDVQTNNMPREMSFSTTTYVRTNPVLLVVPGNTSTITRHRHLK